MRWGKGREPYYSYYSTLSPQEIWMRLMTRGTVAQGGFDYFCENRSFVKFLPDGRFCILTTGGFGTSRSQTPFIGTVTPEGDGSRIVGDFMLEKGWRQGLGLLVVMSLLFLLLGYWITGLFWLTLAALLIWCGLFGCFLWMIAPAMSRPAELLTLKFIEDNLLRE